MILLNINYISFENYRKIPFLRLFIIFLYYQVLCYLSLKKKLISVKGLKNFHRYIICERKWTRRETISGNTIAMSDIMNCSDVTCITSARVTATSSVEARIGNRLANCHRESLRVEFSLLFQFQFSYFLYEFYSLKLSYENVID